MVYDYTNEESRVNELSVMLDTLTQEEAQAALTAIAAARNNEERVQAQKRLDWFNSSLLPILQEFAELNGARLEIDNTENTIEATISNKEGFYVADSNRFFRAVLSAANVLSVSCQDGQAVLALTFDLNGWD